MATSDLTSALDEAGVSYELLPHAHTESAHAEAESLGVSPDDVAKTLIVKLPEGYLRAVLPASARIDLRKVRELHGGGRHTVHLATEEDLRRDYPEFELGAVPPVGGRSDPVVVDPKVAVRTSIRVQRALECRPHSVGIGRVLAASVDGSRGKRNPPAMVPWQGSV